MKELGFKKARPQRTGEAVEKVYSYENEHIISLAKKYLDDLEMLDKIKNICNYVTNVTNVSDRADIDKNNSNTTVTLVTRLQNIKLPFPSFFMNYKDMICPIEDFLNQYSQEILSNALKKGEVFEIIKGRLQLNI
jgi:hypothetical protein